MPASPPATAATSQARAALPRAVLFDLDGTLIDSVPDIAEAVAELMQSQGLARFDEQAVRGMVGYGVRRLVEQAFRAHGITLDAAALSSKTQIMMSIYPRHLSGHTVLMAGAREALDFLEAAGALVALVTNKPQGAAETVLQHFDLTSQFALVVGDSGPTETGGLIPKPAPDMLLFALEKLGVAPVDAVMVGDSAADCQSAAAAGVFSVAIRGGYASAPLENYRPGMVLDSLAALPKALTGWPDVG